MLVRFLLSPWIFYFLAILGLILATLVVMKGKKRLITAKVLENYQDNTDFVYDLMCAEFPDACILKDAPVAFGSSGGVHITQAPDIIYVSRGGVMVITVISGDGAYDNPKTGTWRYRYLGNGGKPVTVSLANPFDTMIPAANTLEGLLVGEKIYVDVQRLVVFSGSAIGMTVKYPEALAVKDLIDYLEAFNQKNTLNGPQFRNAAEVISAFTQYNQHKSLQAKHVSVKVAEKEIPLEDTPVAPINDKAIEKAGNSEETVRISDENDEAAALLREIQNELDKEDALSQNQSDN